MKEVAEVNDDSFAKMTAGLVERHPALYYRMCWRIRIFRSMP